MLVPGSFLSGLELNPNLTGVGLPGWLSGRESLWNAGDMGSVPGSGRSPREGNSNPLQFSCLGNIMDRGAWWAIIHGTVHGVAKELDTTCFPGNSEYKASSSSAGDLGLIPGSGRSPREGNGNPLHIFLPGESHGRRSLVGYSPQGRKDSDKTERLH